ncbi:MAG: transposase [Clostridiales bacterium]|nr:transposase [Clostridiales bacterium]
MNALLNDKLTIAQRKQFGASSEKMADGYEQMNLFNEAEDQADESVQEPQYEEVHSHKLKKPQNKKRSGSFGVSSGTY